MKLNKRQEQFCLAYVKKGKLTGAEVYKKIYRPKSETSARGGACNLLRREDITKRIKELRVKAEKSTIFNIHQQQEYLMELLKDPDATVSEKKEIIKLLGQYQRAFISKIEQKIEQKFDLQQVTLLIKQSKERVV